MNVVDIACMRLHNHLIAQPRFEQPAEVVSRLVAMQAQDYAGALWSVGLRVPNATATDIERALAEKSIVRTWPMRGTLHFVAAADVRWLLRLLTPRIVAGARRRYEQLELDDTTFARSADVFVKELQGGGQLSREAMYRTLEGAGISTMGQRGIHILGRLAQDGLLCFGARAGKQQTFTLLDEWVPPTRQLHRDEALAELTRRYFTGHGPATVQDFMWWSGLNAADARAGLDMAKSMLVHEVVDAQSYWMAPDAAGHCADSGNVYLLPGFDEYLLGYRNRSAVLDPIYGQHVNPGSNGIFSSTIVSGGRVVGTWKRTIKRAAVSIALSPFAPLSESEQLGVAAAADRFAGFLGVPIAGAGV